MSRGNSNLFVTPRLDYHAPVQRDLSLANQIRTMSPDRGSFREQYEDLKYGSRYREARGSFNYQDSLPKRYPPSYQQTGSRRKNGFVYEDIYSKRVWCGEYKPKYDYSSPYKPIKPEYLALPSHLGPSKYSTLPKSWSVSSSNSYKAHFNPIHAAASTATDLNSYDYYRQARNKELANLKFEERNNDHYKIYNEIQDNLPFKYAERKQGDEEMVPWYREIENNRLQRARKMKMEQRGYAQKEPLYQTNKAPVKQQQQQQRMMTQQHIHDNASYGRGNPRRNEYETKKNVTFSEVSGCQENSLITGKQAVQVRELEVSFSQVVDKYNLAREYQEKQPPTLSEKPKTMPNGHCATGSGMDGLKRIPAGKLPLKPGQSFGFISGFAERKYLSQVMAALAVSLAPFAAGLGKGYSSPAIASLQQLKSRRPFNTSSSHDISVSDQQASWVASLSLLGALFGGVMGGVAMRHGRRKVLLVMSLPFSLSWILTVFATSVEMMFFTSFMGGFCCSVVSMVSQVYVSEISLPDIRGCLNAVLKIIGHLGVLMSFTIGAYLDWQQLAMFISIAPIILFCTLIYIPETPSYLVLCGKDEEAYTSLSWLRGPGTDIIQELATIRAHVLATKSFKSKNIHVAGSNTLNALFTARIAGPVMITCGLMLFQRFSGAHAFNFYAVPIFKKTFGGMNPHGGAIAVSFVQLLASCLSGLLIDTVGRLPLLIASSVFMSMALAGFGSYAYYEEVHRNQQLQNVVLNQTLGQNDWIPLLCVLVFTIAFSLGMSPISWLLIGELFPLEFRGTGSALATAFSYLCAFVGVKTFVDFQQMFGLHGAFWLYAFISVGGLCFVVCCVPETKGRDLEEMDPKSVQGMQR